MDEEKKTETEQEEKKERRGLFGARKRERNEKTVLSLYVLAGIYLLYTAFSMIRDLTYDGLITGKTRIFNIIFSIVFAVTAVWVLFSSWKAYKKLKAQEEEEARKTAEERGEPVNEETSAKQSLFGMIRGEGQSSPSIASKAAAYYNPADEEEAVDILEEEADGEESCDKEIDTASSADEDSE